MRCLPILLPVVLAGCASAVDWDQVGIAPAMEAKNSVEVVECDRRSTAAASVFLNSTARPESPEWRAAFQKRMGMFHACMRSKGWVKVPVIGWQKTGTEVREVPADERGGE